MVTNKDGIYILCPKKGNPRKHIDICQLCRYRKGCRTYKGYIQPELPFCIGY